MKRASCLIIFLVSLLCSCAPGIQPLLDDYNSMFDMTSESYWEEMEKASPSNMIPDSVYPVFEDDTFNLEVPSGGTNYMWNLKVSANKDGKEQGKIPPDFDITEPVYGGKTSFLRLYLPGIGLIPGEYVLGVTAEYDGKTYTDNCLLVIYEGVE